MTAKRQRSDSATAAVTAFNSAQKQIPSPKHLSDAEQVYWAAITRARAREDWTEVDLLHAWNLAKLMWQIEESHLEIAEKGMTVVNEKGTQIDNPAFSRLEKLTRLATSLSTKLHVHAEATVGKSEDAAKRATKQRDAENTLEAKDPTLDDFIARPMVN